MNGSSGRPWVPPQELTLQTPRQILRTSWLAALRGQDMDIGPLLNLIVAFALLELLGLLLKWWWLEVTATIGLFPLGTLIISLLLGYFRLRRVERLLACGKPARAVVIAVDSITFRGIHTGRRTEWWCTLEVQDDTGRLLKIATPRSLSPKFSLNQLLTVVYDPENPTRITTYPVAGYGIGRSEK